MIRAAMTDEGVEWKEEGKFAWRRGRSLTRNTLTASALLAPLLFFSTAPLAEQLTEMCAYNNISIIIIIVN